MNSYILPESFFQPTAIHKTQFFVQKFNFVIKDGTMQLSNKWTSGVTVTEFALVFQTNESLQCTSHNIFLCISNKQIFNVTVKELDFVFYIKMLKINLLVSSLHITKTNYVYTFD